MVVSPEALKVRAAWWSPSVMHDVPRWFRRDHLELAKRAYELKPGLGWPRSRFLNTGPGATTLPR